MTALKYVVLSDLHLGAAYSLLTHNNADGTAAPAELSHTGQALADGLRRLLPSLAGDERPTLVLLGDIFDLSFVPASQAMMGFQQLMREFFDEAAGPLFADEVIYVPGNHDHREWRIMRDEMFLNELRKQTSIEIPERPAITDLFHTVDCPIATELMRGALQEDGYTVRSAYPNFAHAAGGRAVIMHHGHFTEPMYRAISVLLEKVTGEPQSQDLDEIERVNGPWIDFFWSSFGDQGHVVSDGIYNLYEATQSADATHNLVHKISDLMLHNLGGAVGLDKDMRIGAHGFDVTLSGLTKGLLDLSLAKIAETERMTHDTVLSDDSVEGLQWYLAGPVANQLEQTDWSANSADGSVPTEYSFIFGHTHKPFQDQVPVAGYDQPVQVWNTGGWVIDHPTMSVVQGGSAMLVSDDAHVCALRLYNDPINEDIGSVRALGTGGPQDKDNPLLAAASQALQAEPGMFDEFSERCLAAILLRDRTLRRKFFDPTVIVDDEREAV